jgi:hypothetical protein
LGLPQIVWVVLFSGGFRVKIEINVFDSPRRLNAEDFGGKRSGDSMPI